MINRIAGIITDHLRRKEIFVQEDYEIYLFGIEQMLSTMMSLVSVIIIAIIMDAYMECLIFIIAFKLIRQYAGGYHASTRLRCYILTNLTVIIVLSVIKYVPLNTVVLLILSVLAGIIIFLFSPVDTENKRIDETEHICYRKRSMIVLWVELIIAVLCTAIYFYEGAKCIVLALLVSAVALTGESVKRIIQFFNFR